MFARPKSKFIISPTKVDLHTVNNKFKYYINPYVADVITENDIRNIYKEEGYDNLEIEANIRVINNGERYKTHFKKVVEDLIEILYISHLNYIPVKISKTDNDFFELYSIINSNALFTELILDTSRIVKLQNIEWKAGILINSNFEYCYPDISSQDRIFLFIHEITNEKQEVIICEYK